MTITVGRAALASVNLIDHAYRHNATPIPQPPDGWDDLT